MGTSCCYCQPLKESLPHDWKVLTFFSNWTISFKATIEHCRHLVRWFKEARNIISRCQPKRIPQLALGSVEWCLCVSLADHLQDNLAELFYPASWICIEKSYLRILLPNSFFLCCPSIHFPSPLFLHHGHGGAAGAYPSYLGCQFDAGPTQRDKHQPHSHLRTF